MFVLFFVFVFVFVFVFLRGGWCPQVLLEPPSVTGGTKHIETVQTAATASKVYIWKTFEFKVVPPSGEGWKEGIWKILKL